MEFLLITYFLLKNCLYYRPNFIEILPEDFFYLYHTQSHNSSANLALVINDVSRNNLELVKRVFWNKIPSFSLYNSHQAFVTEKQAFYTRMMRKTVNRLIDAGIIKFILSKYHKINTKPLEDDDGPKILSLNDLAFGFNIWLGFCALSIVALILEKVFELVNTPRRIKFAKIHPLPHDDLVTYNIYYRSYYNKFRVTKKKSTNYRLSSSLSTIFGEKISDVD